MAFSIQVEQAILKYSAQYDVEAALIRAIIQQESSGNPNAKGDYDADGVPHSFGLMQLYDKGAGAGYSPAFLLVIENNVSIGTRYLKSCLDAFPGDLKTAISAYNQGIAGARDRGWTHNRAYVESVLSYYGKPVEEIPEEKPPGEAHLGVQIVPTDSETITHWKNTFDKIALGCSTYIFIAIIIIIIIILIVRY